MTPERELAELRSKVEEFRKWLRDATVDYYVPARAVQMLDDILPPPKRGCWGFWRNLSRSDAARIFIWCYSQEHAEKCVPAHRDFNPGSVIFLEEK